MQFPTGLFTDVRYETVGTTNIVYENGVLKQNKTALEQGAFIRVFDGVRWYYSATTDLNAVQAEIDGLAAMATPNGQILDHPVVKKLQANKDVCLRFTDFDLSRVPNGDKVRCLESYLPLMGELEDLQMHRLSYLDTHVEKHIISSLGADVTFDYQHCAIHMVYAFGCDGTPFQNIQYRYKQRFDELLDLHDQFRRDLARDWDYAHHAVPVVPGVYTCVLAPEVTGVFAHESFGHKSESDFMIGDETMKREWALGTKVGVDMLNIYDTGSPDGSGYVPYDDEGTKATKTYLIKDGILTGRLHSAYTAAALEEAVTGNARAMSFEYEPIVRMTSTCIGGGGLTVDELIGGVKEGVYIKDYKHGSGMSTFTIAPNVAYMIRDGKLAEPVRIAVITGNVMETLHQIDGLANDTRLCSSASGGCGKMEQWPLRVAFGGPHMRVNGIQVQ